MGKLTDLWFRIRALLGGSRLDEEFTAEAAFHLEMETDELIRKGMDPAEARRVARIAFGGVDRYREKAREARGAGWFQDLGKDIRLAFRRLRQSPGTPLAVILCMSLGLGATSGVFSFFFGILLRPLPFPDADGLAILFETAPEFTRASPSFLDYEGWRAEARSFSGMGAYSGVSRTFTGPEGPEILAGTGVSHNLFRILGVGPALGRGFLEEDDGPGAPPTVILSHSVWEERFGGTREVLGAAVNLNGRPHTIVGIMPSGFAFPDDARFWIPLRTNAAPRTGTLSAVVGRLAEGETLQRAQLDMDRVAALMREAYPEANAQREVAVRALREDFLFGLETPAKLFLLVAGFVLLLATANVTNILLAQGATRRREMAVRAAIGASRGRVLRQVLTESLILAGLGGVGGALLGMAGRNLYLSLIPEANPYYIRFDMDAPVLGFLVLVTLGTGLLFGLAPALEGVRGDLFATLKGGGGEMTLFGRGTRRKLRFLPWRKIGFRGGLLALQTGLALAVLVGTGMAARSLGTLRAVDTGIDPENILTLTIALSSELRDDEDRLRLAFDEIRDRVAGLPGVDRAAIISHLPIRGAANGTSLYAEGSEPPPPGQEPWVITKQSQPGYFQTMGIRLMAGRDFSEADGNPGSPPVVIVNESFSQRYWPNESALGKRVKYGRPDSEYPWMAIIGVAADVHHFGPDRPVQFGMYEPFHQVPYWRETLVVQAENDPAVLTRAIRGEVRAVDPDAPVYSIHTMSEVLYLNYWRPIVLSRLLWVFSVLALLLASLGVFGVVTFLTGQRKREFAIRLATGAEKSVVVAQAFRSTLPSLLLGMLGGGLAAWMGMRFASSLLFGVESLDPGVMALCVVAIIVVVGGAVFLPAWKTAQLDPADVLRRD